MVYTKIYYVSFSRESAMDYIKKDIMNNDLGLVNYNYLDGYNIHDDGYSNNVYDYHIREYNEQEYNEQGKRKSNVISYSHFLEYIPLYLIVDHSGYVEYISFNKENTITPAKNVVETIKTRLGSDELYIQGITPENIIKRFDPLIKYMYIHPDNRLNIEKSWVTRDKLSRICLERCSKKFSKRVLKILSEYYFNNTLINPRLYSTSIINTVYEVLDEIKYQTQLSLINTSN